MYIYEGHIGSIYTSENQIDYDDLYCETCGDKDYLIGYADTLEEALALFSDEDWNMDYIKECLEGSFN
jgi:hypothetical protein